MDKKTQAQETKTLSQEEAVLYLKDFVRIARLLTAIIHVQPKENVIGPEIDVPFVETGVCKTITRKLDEMEVLLGLRSY